MKGKHEEKKGAANECHTKGILNNRWKYTKRIETLISFRIFGFHKCWFFFGWYSVLFFGDFIFAHLLVLCIFNGSNDWNFQWEEDCWVCLCVEIQSKRFRSNSHCQLIWIWICNESEISNKKQLSLCVALYTLYVFGIRHTLCTIEK